MGTISGKDGRQTGTGELEDSQTSDGGEPDITPVEICKFGVPCEPAEFVRRAIQAGHPKDLLAQVSSLIEGSLEVKLPTIWTVEKQR